MVLHLVHQRACPCVPAEEGRRNEPRRRLPSARRAQMAAVTCWEPHLDALGIDPKHNRRIATVAAVAWQDDRCAGGVAHAPRIEPRLPTSYLMNKVAPAVMMDAPSSTTSARLLQTHARERIGAQEHRYGRYGANLRSAPSTGYIEKVQTACGSRRGYRITVLQGDGTRRQT
jgi:hypothetical protein